MTHPTLAAACGALGRFDPERLDAIAACLPRASRTVLDEPECCLRIDRQPLHWSAGGDDGVCWAEQPLATARPRDLDAAEALGPGVGGRPGRRLLHASASGAAPLYVMRDGDGEACYFASTVDALARSAPRRLAIDWEAWASILTLGYPIGARTPFREIARLEPGCRLVPGSGGGGHGGRGGGAASWALREEWSWERITPERTVEDAALDVIDAMRTATRSLPGGPLVCQLSGGLDSRLCLGLAIERRAGDVAAVTADQDLGHDAEQRAARALAGALGVPHSVAAGPQVSFWDDLELLALRTDYQLVRPPWRISLLPALRAAGGTVLDGFGFDTLAAPGDRFLGEATADLAGRDEVVEALWSAMSTRRARPGALGLGSMLSEALWESAREQLRASSRRFDGHPSRSLLTFYRARQVRGIALEPQAILGTEVAVAMPLATDAVARAALSVPVAEKRGGRLYEAVFERLDPRLRAVVSTRSEGRAAVATTAIARPSQSRDVAEAMRACLADGPLAGELLPGKLRALGRGGGTARTAGAGDPARVPRGLMGIAFLHLWHARYADHLEPVDTADAFSLTGRRSATPDR